MTAFTSLSDAGVRTVKMLQRKRPHRKVPRLLGSQVRSVSWAFRHVSLEIREPEIVFISDPETPQNAGVLLRVACGLLRPDEGSAESPVRSVLVRPFLNRTTNSLSANQALRVLAGIYGMTDREIDHFFDTMVDFAEIRRYLYQPVEELPTGMLPAMAFTAATTVPARLFAFDRTEIVGTKEFQLKCRRRLRDLREAGAALIVSTIRAPLIAEFADRGLLLANGECRVMDGAELARQVREWPTRAGKRPDKRPKRG